MSLIYEATNLVKCYNSHLALQLASFTLEKGSSLVLLGPNGSGKSTFLRLLAFIESPSSGILKYLEPGEPRRACTLVLQEAWLLKLTVFQNVVLGLKLRGMKSALIEKYNAAMKAVGFSSPEEYAQRRPHMLSGGEKQRVALASRLILEPVVLLLDEPTAYVDAKSAAYIMAALQKIHDQGTTIVCATHDRLLADSLSAQRLELFRPD